MGSLLQMTSLVMQINKNEFQKTAGPTLKRKSLHPSFKASKGGGFYYPDKNGYYVLFVESKNIILHNY